MPIINLDDLEVWMGVTFSDTQAAQANLMIDYVNQYIEDETGTKFGLEEGVVQRIKADCDGAIQFTNIPVSAINSIHDYFTDTDLSTDVWYWDGVDCITGFYAGQVVDVDMDFGWPELPGSVKGVALAMAARGVGQLRSNSPSGVTLKQVGDVIYEYGDVMAPSQTEQTILDNYAVTETTIAVNVHRMLIPRVTGNYLAFPDVSYMPNGVID